jgi:hypothetical protein
MVWSQHFCTCCLQRLGVMASLSTHNKLLAAGVAERSAVGSQGTVWLPTSFCAYGTSLLECCIMHPLKEASLAGISWHQLL